CGARVGEAGLPRPRMARGTRHAARERSDMATMREIRNRIRTVKNIEKITRAMKLVAAARLKRAQSRVEAARPYAEKMQRVMQNLARAAGSVSHPLLEVREER